MTTVLFRKGMVFAIIVLFVGVGILSSDSVYGFGDPLTVSAPDNVNVGEEITITVTSDGDPVQGADVYVNGINNIGSTNSNGEIEYVFDFIGIYIVSAYKFGYDLSNTVSVTVEQPLLTLSIEPLAPTTNDEVTITVKENLMDTVSGVTVKIDSSSIGTTDSNGEIEHTFLDADVYSITAEKGGYTDSLPYIVTVTDFSPLLVVTHVSPVAPEVGSAVTFSVTANFEEIEGATIEIDGVSKGTTNEGGEFQYTFNEGGLYEITAEKNGYTDSFSYLLNIIEIESWLTIDSIIPSKVDEEITITVRENIIGETVNGASVSIKKNLTGYSYDFIGTTDGTGSISYTFDEGGSYLIKAEKDGYVDGFGSIIITDIDLPDLSFSVSLIGAVFPLPDSL